MNCQDGHNTISKEKKITKDGYGYCLTCRQYRKLIFETEGDLREIDNLLFMKKIEEEDNRHAKEEENSR